MEYEDTNILRTQYVDDLVSQRQALEDALIYQNGEVEPNEGLNTMVPKVEALTGLKPGLPFINFFNSTVYDVSNINLNSIAPENLNKVFKGAIAIGKYNAPLDLKAITGFKQVTDFSYMFATNAASRSTSTYLKLSKYFDLTNATTIKGLFAWTNTNSSQASVSLTLSGVDEIPIMYCKSLEDMELACVHPNSVDLLKLFLKIYDAPVKTLKGFFRSIRGYYSSIYVDSELFSKLLKHMRTEWDLSQLEDMSYFCYGHAYNENMESIFKWFGTLDWSKVKDISHMIEVPTNATVPVADRNKVLDLSMVSFDSLETAQTCFSMANIMEVKLGPALNKTIKNISYCFRDKFSSEPSKKIINAAFWDLGAVTNCSYCFQYCTVLETLYFGLNLGEGYTYKSNNYSSYSINLSESKILSVESVNYLFDKIYDLNLRYDVANGGKLYTQKIDLHADVIAKLTPEEIAIATNKGWTVV